MLQALSGPIYHLTKKGIPYVWTKHQQKYFDIIKRKLSEPPVLSCLTAEGRLILCSDTSHTHAGSAMWQMQDGKPCLLGYASKTLPPACANYSVSELEMSSLLVNIYLWQHLIHETEFDVAMDHQALVYIMKGKTAPATKRIA